MHLKHTGYTNAELIRMVDNTQDATPMERLLAERLDTLVAEADKTIERRLGVPYGGYRDINGAPV